MASGVRSGSTFIAESIAYHFHAAAGMIRVLPINLCSPPTPFSYAHVRRTLA
jgi:hypothetical protein